MDTSTYLLDTLSEAILIANSKGIIEYINEPVEEMFGYHKEELIGRPLHILIPYDFRGKHFEHMSVFFSSPAKRKMGKGRTLHGQRKNQTTFPIEVSLSHAKIQEKNVAIALVVDISERVAIWAELEKSRATYASIVENTSDHVFKINTEGVVEYINHTAPGLSKDEVIGTLLIDLQPDEKSRQLVSKIMNSTLQQGKSHLYETSYPSPVGQLNYSTIICPIIEAGKITGATLVSRNLTNEIRMKKQLIEKQLFIDRLDKNSINGIYIYNFNLGKNIYVNSQYSDILGYTIQDMNELSQKEFFSLFHVDDREKLKEHMEKVGQLRPGETSEIIYRFKAKSGAWKWCISRDSGFEYTSDGNVLSFMGAFVDITEQKEIEVELRKKHAEMQNFVSIASHDLRSPISSIIQMLELMKQDNIILENPNLKRTVELTYTSALRMFGLLNSLLHNAMIGKNPQLDTIVLKGLMEDVLFDLKSSVDENSAQIDLPSQNIELQVYVTEFRQLLQNLISNAIKFRKSDVIPQIKIYATERVSHYLFEVSDNGIGISEEHTQRIFEIFEKLHSADEYSGAGIGLANCKKIVNLHKGDIWVESELEVGSRFFFTVSKHLD